MKCEVDESVSRPESVPVVPDKPPLCAVAPVNVEAPATASEAALTLPKAPTMLCRMNSPAAL